MTAPTPATHMAPARFLGIQPGFGNNPAIELYVLLSPVGFHPVGSVVSRQTLERHGFIPQEVTPQHGMSAVQIPLGF